MSDRQKLNRLLDDLADKQKHVTQCHDYYEALEKEIEKKSLQEKKIAQEQEQAKS